MRYKIDYNELYKVYKEQRAKSLKYLKSRGGKVRLVDGEPLEASSFEEFKVDLLSSLEDSPRKGPKELAKRLAKDEVYPVTAKQAQQFAEAESKLFGTDVNISSLTKFRLGFTGPLFERIELYKQQKRQEYANEGKRISSFQLNLLVGQEFFGSP